MADQDVPTVVRHVLFAAVVWALVLAVASWAEGQAPPADDFERLELRVDGEVKAWCPYRHALMGWSLSHGLEDKTRCEARVYRRQGPDVVILWCRTKDGWTHLSNGAVSTDLTLGARLIEARLQ